MFTPPHRPHRERGVALIIVLFFIVILTVMIVGLLDSSRVERSAALSHADRLRAASSAREGLELVTATLHRQTSDPTRKPAESDDDYNKRKRNWISQPGMLIVPNDPNPSNPNDPLADQKQLRKPVPLSSGTPSSAFLAQASLDPVFRPPNLNVKTLVEQIPPTHLITNRGEKPAGGTVEEPFEMALRWVYVRQDGSYELKADGSPKEPPLDTVSLTNKANPIVSRFAYWTDDESSKVNYNLAWKRDPTGATSSNPNTSQAAHPSRVNLMGLTFAEGSPLTEPMADAIHNWITKTPARYFNSFADARQVSPDVARMLDFNKFELTHYNHDPDTTFFGEDRIMLTTNRNLVPKVYNPDGSVAKNPDGTVKYARKFLDIMRDKNADGTPVDPEKLDPGILEHIAGGQPDWNANSSGSILLPNKFDAAVRNVMRYVSEKNWPLSPGVSFKDKYYPGTADTSARIGQLAINIIDYVRAKESPTQIISPIRFAVGPANAVGDNVNKFTIHPSYTYGAANSYQGLSRGPYITEAGMWMEKDPVPAPTPIPLGWPTEADPAAPGKTRPKKLYRCYFKGELFLPANYGFPKDGIELVPDPAAKPKQDAAPGKGSYGYFFTWTETRDQTVAVYYGVNPDGKLVDMDAAGNNASRIFKADIARGLGPNGTSLTPGNYVTVTKMIYRDKDYTTRKTLSTRMVLYYGTSGTDGFLSGNGNRWPRVNIATQAIAISYPVGDPNTTTQDSMPSIEVDDPRCNVHPSDWVYNKAGNTFGAINSISTLGKAPTKSPIGKPQQDTYQGKISDWSFYMPPPKGTVGTSNDAARDNGRVVSIAELGYVHTGNEANTGSTPWRTIRLQPNNYPDAKTLPDWAFMDLFTVPNTAATGTDALFKPHGTAVGGRVNVNSHVEPFDKLVRDRGLVALLTGAGSLASPAAAKVVADNIYNRALADGANKGKVYGYPWPTNPTAAIPANLPNAFDTPGEICEIKGVADDGEKSEDLVREFASLVTSRGGVFSVFTIGQALKQTPNGKLLVMAEQRQQAMVERYLDNKGTPDAGDDETRTRTVYFRNLTP